MSLRCYVAQMRARARLVHIGAVVAAVGSLACAVPSAANAAQDPSAPAITRAYNAWATAVADADCDGADVAVLYTPQAILLATFKDYVAGRPAITHYFDDLTCKENLTVTTQRITTERVGAMGYATGLYTFKYDTVDGTTIDVPARFTFVFERRNGQWLIVNHHSSMAPQSI